MEIRLRYLVADVDRHGNPRLYVRKRGCPKIRIKAAPGTTEFLRAYEDALQAIRTGNYPNSKGGKGKSLYDAPKGDTLRGLVHLYEQSAEARQLTPRGQRVRHLILRSCLDEETRPGSGVCLGECPTDQVTIDVIRLMRDRKQDKKAASANRVKAMRIVLDWAVERDFLKINVARHLKPLKYQKVGFHTWTEDEVEQFVQRHPIGTRPRLAMALMAFTGMRRSDAVLVGSSHVKNGAVEAARAGSAPSLCSPACSGSFRTRREVLDGTELGEQTFLVTERGQPFTATRRVLSIARRMASARRGRRLRPRTVRPRSR
jgi:hypothetical protein